MHSIFCNTQFFTLACKAIEGPSKGKKCIFPFKYFGKSYNECTWNDAPTKKPWCSTNVTEDGYHIEENGNWGVCGNGCSIPGRNKLNDISEQDLNDTLY